MLRGVIEDIRESFEDFSSELGDHRIERNKLHRVEEILRTFFPYPHGIPSDDTLRRFFRFLDPGKFQVCFASWTQTLDVNKEHVSIDGKVSRRSFDRDNNPLHLVSAFASESRLVLAQEKVEDKSNEITAIPKLLDLLDLAGSIVTIDAMGCQKEIAKIIRDKGADYVLSLKGNQ